MVLGRGAISLFSGGRSWSLLEHWQDANPRMRSTVLSASILGGCFASALLFSAGSAQAKPSFGDCAKQIEQRGYAIYEMELKRSVYDIDATKGGRRWDLRADENCRIIDERPD